jgi:hypothetical protein
MQLRIEKRKMKSGERRMSREDRKKDPNIGF